MKRIMDQHMLSKSGGGSALSDAQVHKLQKALEGASLENQRLKVDNGALQNESQAAVRCCDMVYGCDMYYLVTFCILPDTLLPFPSASEFPNQNQALDSVQDRLHGLLNDIAQLRRSEKSSS